MFAEEIVYISIARFKDRGYIGSCRER